MVNAASQLLPKWIYLRGSKETHNRIVGSQSVLTFETLELTFSSIRPFNTVLSNSTRQTRPEWPLLRILHALSFINDWTIIEGVHKPH